MAQLILTEYTPKSTDTIDFPAEHWPALKAYIAKTYGKSREHKVREAVEEYRYRKVAPTNFILTPKERARHFAREQSLMKAYKTVNIEIDPDTAEAAP